MPTPVKNLRTSLKKGSEFDAFCCVFDVGAMGGEWRRWNCRIGAEISNRAICFVFSLSLFFLSHTVRMYTYLCICNIQNSTVYTEYTSMREKDWSIIVYFQVQYLNIYIKYVITNYADIIWNISSWWCVTVPYPTSLDRDGLPLKCFLWAVLY
jgi:hypothetical protein